MSKFIEPKGCPTPGACSAKPLAGRIETLERFVAAFDAWRAVAWDTDRIQERPAARMAMLRAREELEGGG